MRLFVMLIGLLAALLAACAPAGQAEPTVAGAPEPEGTPTDPALNSVPNADDSYPAAGEGGDEAYPAPGLESALPEGYPLSTLVSPVEVDLGEVTPVAGDPTPRVMPSPGRPGGPTENMGGLMEAVVLNLTRHLDTQADAVSVVSTESVTWPNGGLGCPEEGMAYAEVMVEGSRITLEADGQTYTYHTSSGGEFVLCVDGQPVSRGVVPR